MWAQCNIQIFLPWCLVWWQHNNTTRTPWGSTFRQVLSQLLGISASRLGQVWFLSIYSPWCLKHFSCAKVIQTVQLAWLIKNYMPPREPLKPINPINAFFSGPIFFFSVNDLQNLHKPIIFVEPSWSYYLIQYNLLVSLCNQFYGDKHHSNWTELNWSLAQSYKPRTNRRTKDHTGCDGK